MLLCRFWAHEKYFFRGQKMTFFPSSIDSRTDAFLEKSHFFGQMGLANGLARSKSQPFHIILEDFDSYGKITSKSGLLGHSEELIRRASDFFWPENRHFRCYPLYAADFFFPRVCRRFSGSHKKCFVLSTLIGTMNSNLCVCSLQHVLCFCLSG